MQPRLASWLGLAVVVMVSSSVAVPAVAADIVQLTVRVRDERGREMPGRVLVRDDAGRSHVPPVAVTENIGPDTWFVCNGSARLDVPRGRYELQAERGPEFDRALVTADVEANMTREFTLRRWIDMSARGFRSGENHLHVPGASLEPILAAEGLDYGSSLQWWNGPRFSVPSRGAADPRLTLFDAEVENAWGAVYCVGLRSPLALEWNPRRANLRYVEVARAAGALIAYQGGWSAEAPVDALLGLVDVINIGDNLFHRHKYMPRARNSNVLGAEGLPVYPETPEGMLALATESYYRLLNCGLRLAAGAGSATGVKSSPAGYNRAYVRVANGATASEFLDAWRRGENFVTNGPMLFLEVNGVEPGARVAIPATGGSVRVAVNAASLDPLQSVEVVVNGKVIAATSGGPIDQVITVSEGSWIAARCTSLEPTRDGAPARYAQSSRLGGEQSTGLHFAHTSPVYVTVGGRGPRVRRSVDEVGVLLTAFERFAARTAAPEYAAEIQDAVTRAQQRLSAREGSAQP